MGHAYVAIVTVIFVVIWSCNCKTELSCLSLYQSNACSPASHDPATSSMPATLKCVPAALLLPADDACVGCRVPLARQSRSMLVQDKLRGACCALSGERRLPPKGRPSDQVRAHCPSLYTSAVGSALRRQPCYITPGAVHAALQGLQWGLLKLGPLLPRNSWAEKQTNGSSAFYQPAIRRDTYNKHESKMMRYGAVRQVMLVQGCLVQELH